MTSAETFANEYLGKVFYFCLKKTGNDADAEELDFTVGIHFCRYSLRMAAIRLRSSLP